MVDEIDKFLNRDIDNVIEWTNVLEKMLEAGYVYKYASETLRGILEYVHEHGTITENQIHAIENIRAAPSSPRYGRRRY